MSEGFDHLDSATHLYLTRLVEHQEMTRIAFCMPGREPPGGGPEWIDTLWSRGLWETRETRELGVSLRATEDRLMRDFQAHVAYVVPVTAPSICHIVRWIFEIGYIVRFFDGEPLRKTNGFTLSRSRLHFVTQDTIRRYAEYQYRWDQVSFQKFVRRAHYSRKDHP